ncbi:uncharacterized protein LOC108256181 isoform X2 [Ictalurus punctatus]|uniref:Uncharacterized protein LOC108256181 isoform X2 n=1 Tax=Ictalurus punctatus TaxID=7998 RepID=A0A979EB48_ICTPU|nr:uncharacterized protein LOC108256181 isoform X2 [Ictalurus punctatus]
MSGVAEWILENKDKIEKGVEILGKGCEILAVTVGQFNPILEAVFMVSAELLGNPEGNEAKYLADQFESVNQKLEKVQGEIEKTQLVLQRSSLNIENFTFYTQIINQENSSGDAMLDTILATEQRSRRAVEEFCASMKKVFVVGIVALMGYAALKEGTVEEDMVKKWQDRMEEVEKRMKAAVDECVDNFPAQAKIDINQKLTERQSSVDPEFTKFILDALVKKYDWVSWSVRVFKDDDSRLGRFLFGKRRHINGGDNYFDFLSNNKIRIVVSFTADPKPLNKSQINDEIEEKKGDMKSMAESLCRSFPNCHVHAVSRANRVEEANNFNPEHFYYIHHKKADICIHSE